VVRANRSAGAVGARIPLGWRRSRSATTLVRPVSIFVIWIAFRAYWLLAAVQAKQSVSNKRTWWPRLVVVIVGVLLLHVFKTGSLAVHAPVLQAVGAAFFVAGLLLAVWARIYLGRNWGMSMTQRAEPELVTSGPYAYVRHPIYSGILLAILGTALATNLY